MLAIMARDYEDESMDVSPTADPEAISQFHKMARAEAILGTIQFGANTRAALTRYYDALEVENPEELLPPPPEEQAPDPELVLKDREVAVKEGQLQLDSQIKLGDQQLKQFAAMQKANNDAQNIELGAMKITLDHSSKSGEAKSGSKPGKSK